MIAAAQDGPGHGGAAAFHVPARRRPFKPVVVAVGFMLPTAAAASIAVAAPSARLVSGGLFAVMVLGELFFSRHAPEPASLRYPAPREREAYGSARILAAVQAFSLAATAITPGFPTPLRVAAAAMLLPDIRQSVLGSLQGARRKFLPVGLICGALAALGAGWWAIAHRGTLFFQLPSMFGGRNSLPVIMAFVLIGSGVNAVAEESLWRGALPRIMTGFGCRPGWNGLVLSMGFGLAHLHGLPDGLSGVVLTGTFGLMMAVVVRRSRSLWPAVVSHVAADIALLGLILPA